MTIAGLWEWPLQGAGAWIRQDRTEKDGQDKQD